MHTFKNDNIVKKISPHIYSFQAGFKILVYSGTLIEIAEKLVYRLGGSLFQSDAIISHKKKIDEQWKALFISNEESINRTDRLNSSENLSLNYNWEIDYGVNAVFKCADSSFFGIVFDVKQFTGNAFQSDYITALYLIRN